MSILSGYDSFLAIGGTIMNASPESTSGLKDTPGFIIMSCNTVEELSQKVSEALNDGTLCLHGQPFIFKDQVCQAVKLVGQS
jgi:hypothetical protein